MLVEFDFSKSTKSINEWNDFEKKYFFLNAKTINILFYT